MPRLTTYDRGEITVLGNRATIPANTKKNSNILRTTSGEQSVLIVNISTIYDICLSANLEKACGQENTSKLAHCFCTLLRKYNLSPYYILSGDIMIYEVSNRTGYNSAADITINEAIGLLENVADEIASDVTPPEITEYRQLLCQCQKAWDGKSKT